MGDCAGCGMKGLWVNDIPGRPDPTRHNYYAKVVRLLESGAGSEPGLKHVHIFHDDGCSIYNGGYCDCDAVVELTSEADCDKVRERLQAEGRL